MRGDIIEIYPANEDNAYRIEMWGNQIDKIRQIDPLTGEIRPGQEDLSRVSIYPKTHYVMPAEQRERAIQSIYAELDWWKKELERQGKICRGAARDAAHDVRYRDDADRGLLPRRRELFAAS